MFNNLFNSAKKFLDSIFAPKKPTSAPKPTPKPQPKPIAPIPKWTAPPIATWGQSAQSIAQATQNWARSGVNTAYNAWSGNRASQAQAQARAQAEAQARARAEAEARARREALRRQVQGVVDGFKGIWSGKNKQSVQKGKDIAGKSKGGKNMVILNPKIDTTKYAPIEPLAPVPALPTPYWTDQNGVTHVVGDVKEYEDSVTRYNTEYNDYIGKRFEYSNKLFEHNQSKAEKARTDARVEEQMRLNKAKYEDKNANVWGKIGNFFTGGKTQAERNKIKGSIESENKKLSEDAILAQNQMERENERWIGLLQKKLEAGDTRGFEEEFKKYDKYMTGVQSSLTGTQFKAWGKQEAQQSFLGKTKTQGLVGKGMDAGGNLLGFALDTLDLPRRGINTVWNKVDPTRTRTYYDGTVKTDKVDTWGKAWNESYGQNVISQHQKKDFNFDEAKKKNATAWKNYQEAQGSKNVKKFWLDQGFRAGMSDQEFHKKLWDQQEQQAVNSSWAQDFVADPLLFGGKVSKLGRWAKGTKTGTQAFKTADKVWTASGKKGLMWSGEQVKKITSNPKVASAIVGSYMALDQSKLGRAVKWAKKDSTATVANRWAHDAEVQKAIQGRDLLKAEYDELMTSRFDKTFNKNLQLLPTKIKDASGKMVRVEGVDVLKSKMAKMTPTQSRAFNHYVQPRYAKDGKTRISPSYSWAGQESYYKKLSRKDRQVVQNLASSYKAVTDKLYSIDRLSAKRGFSKVPSSYRTYHGTPYEGGRPYVDRPLTKYSKRQGYVASKFKRKSWSERREKMTKFFRVGDKVTSAKPVEKFTNPRRKDPYFTQHKKKAFTNQSGRELSEALDTRIKATRREYVKTVPEYQIAKTEGKKWRGYVQNKNERVMVNGKLENRYNPNIKERSGIKGYEADLADLASRRTFKKGAWEKVMSVAGLPKRVWVGAVTKGRPAWYINNVAWNIPASYASAEGIGGVTRSYGKILTEAFKQRTLRPEILKALPEGVISSSTKFGELGSNLENLSRASAYMAMVDNGIPHKQALARVNDWLFDYTKMKNWERPLKTVMPFWSWHKGLATIAVKAPIKYPTSAFVLASFKREFMEKPLSEIPDEAVTWRDPITGEEVKMNKRDLYKGKMRIWGSGKDSTWVNTPFFPFGESSISMHPIADLFEEYKSGMDKYGRDTTDKDFWRLAVGRIPQLEIVARAYEMSDQKMNPEKFISRWVAENGSTKWAQGYDPSATNYKEELDYSKRFWDNARSFAGIPNTYNYDYTSNDFKSRMSEFQRKYFSNEQQAKWEAMDWDKRDASQKALAKEHGLSLDEVYKHWSKYDTDSTAHIKAQKQEAREISGKFWEEYFKKDKGQKYIKDVQEGKKSERAEFLREYLIKGLASGNFARNRFLIEGDTIRKTLMGLAQGMEYSKVQARRAVYIEGVKSKMASYKRAKSSGNWTDYNRVYGKSRSKGTSEKAKIVREAVRTGDWTAYRKRYGSKLTVTRSAEAKFWAKYAEASQSERKQLLLDNPEYNKRANWTDADWKKWRDDRRVSQRAQISSVAGDKVAKNITAFQPKADEVWARRSRKKGFVKTKWKR